MGLGTNISRDASLALVGGASCLSVGGPGHIVIVEEAVGPDLVRGHHQLEGVSLPHRQERDTTVRKGT